MIDLLEISVFHDEVCQFLNDKELNQIDFRLELEDENYTDSKIVDDCIEYYFNNNDVEQIRVSSDVKEHETYFNEIIYKNGDFK